MGGAANAFINQVRFSAAYDLTGEFGQGFGSYLATTEDRFRGEIQISTCDRIQVTTLGEAPSIPIVPPSAARWASTASSVT
nr:hypothetical protein [Methylorubrum salsuginis]